MPSRHETILRFAKAAPATWIFLICLTIYAAITPWMAVRNWTDGDEPAYLLLAHSLVVDHDFDVSNNYQSKDYCVFYPYDISEADQHIVRGRRGEKLLWHDIGLSVLIAPGYWVAGRMGAMIVMNVVAALLASAIFVLARNLGAGEMAAAACSLMFAFSSPLIYYSSQIYPEVAGAACSAWAVVFFIRYIETRRLVWLTAEGMLLALLPWLCIRFWMLAGGLAVVLVAHFFAARKQIAWSQLAKAATAAGLPLAITLVAFGAFDYRYFGTLLPNAGYLSIRDSYPQFWPWAHLGFLGMLLDRGNGLLPIAPVYVIAFAGALRHSKRIWEKAAMLAPALAYGGLMSLSRHWDGGFSPAGRYILCSAAMLTPFAALVITETRARPFTVILGLWTLLVAAAYTALPRLFYPYLAYGIHGGLNQFLLERLHIEPGVIFPSIWRGGPSDFALAAVWAVAIFACMCWLNPGGARKSTATKLVAVATGGVLLSCAISYASLRQREGADSSDPRTEQRERAVTMDSPLVKFDQDLSSPQKQALLKPGQATTIPVTIRNVTGVTLSTNGRYPITLSYTWLDSGNPLPIKGDRTLLSRALKPGEQETVNAKVTAPQSGTDLTLRFSLVQEGVAWFVSKDGRPLEIPVHIER